MTPDRRSLNNHALRIAALLMALALPALALSACGTKSEEVDPVREEFSLALDWYPNPDHAGIYAAQELGYFEDAGLDVALDAPTDPALPIKLVAAGRADLAVSYEPEVLLARQQGLDVVAVAALVDRPLTSMIWLKKSGIKRVADLKGKTISTAGIPYQQAYLRAILGRAGLSENDVRVVGVGQGLTPSILSGRAQATLGPFWNIEGVDLKLSGRRPVVNPVDRLGVPPYSEMVLVAQGKRLEEDPDAIRLFIRALERGTGVAVERPNFATRTILNANPALKPRVTAAQTRVTLPLLARQDPSRPFGYMDMARWQKFIDWMVGEGALDSPQRAVDALSNDLLPTGQVEPG